MNACKGQVYARHVLVWQVLLHTFLLLDLILLSYSVRFHPSSRTGHRYDKSSFFCASRHDELVSEETDSVLFDGELYLTYWRMLSASISSTLSVSSRIGTLLRFKSCWRQQQVGVRWPETSRLLAILRLRWLDRFLDYQNLISPTFPCWS